MTVDVRPVFPAACFLGLGGPSIDKGKLLKPPVATAGGWYHFAVTAPPNFFTSTSFALSTSVASLPEISHV